jgi:hypothetical protein
MFRIFLIALGIVSLLCLLAAIRCLLAASGECQLPDIEDIQVEQDTV